MSSVFSCTLQREKLWERNLSTWVWRLTLQNAFITTTLLLNVSSHEKKPLTDSLLGSNPGNVTKGRVLFRHRRAKHETQWRGRNRSAVVSAFVLAETATTRPCLL